MAPRKTRFRDQVRSLLDIGQPPSEIAIALEVPIARVFRACDELVRSGAVRLSDIVYSIRGNRRANVVSYVAAARAGKLREFVDQDPATWEQRVRDAELDTATWIRYGTTRQFLGEVYEDVRALELRLFDVVKDVLQKRFDARWWDKGVPEWVRRTCDQRWDTEGRPKGVPRELYLDLGSLMEIIKAERPVFATLLRAFPGGFEALVKLRGIRNYVMHPCRGKTPTEDDIAFVKKLRRSTFMKPVKSI